MKKPCNVARLFLLSCQAYSIKLRFAVLVFQTRFLHFQCRAAYLVTFHYTQSVRHFCRSKVAAAGMYLVFAAGAISNQDG